MGVLPLHLHICLPSQWSLLMHRTCAVIVSSNMLALVSLGPTQIVVKLCFLLYLTFSNENINSTFLTFVFVAKFILKLETLANVIKPKVTKFN